MIKGEGNWKHKPQNVPHGVWFLQTVLIVFACLVVCLGIVVFLMQ